MDGIRQPAVGGEKKGDQRVRVKQAGGAAVGGAAAAPDGGMRWCQEVEAGATIFRPSEEDGLEVHSGELRTLSCWSAAPVGRESIAAPEAIQCL